MSLQLKATIDFVAKFYPSATILFQILFKKKKITFNASLNFSKGQVHLMGLQQPVE